jgi:hypothetical protein
MNSLEKLQKLLRDGRRYTDMKSSDYAPDSDAYRIAHRLWTKQLNAALAEAGAADLFRDKLKTVREMPLQNHERPEHDWEWRLFCHALEWVLMEFY